MGPCQSCRCAGQAATFLGSLLRWSKEQVEHEATRFVNARWRGNHPVLYGEQAKQEEYARALHMMSSGEET
jgi:hypothetical protein